MTLCLLCVAPNTKLKYIILYYIILYYVSYVLHLTQNSNTRYILYGSLCVTFQYLTL